MGSALEVISEAFGAYSRGDLDAVLDRAHDDVVFVPVYYDGAVFSGKAQVARFFRSVDDPRQQWWPVTLDFEPVGEDRVLVVGRIGILGTLDGAPLDLPVAWIFHVEDGLILRMVGFVNEREAREALGLDPVGRS